MSEEDRFQLARGASRLVGERHVLAAEGPDIVLLHAGVCDRRSWSHTIAGLDRARTVVAYDRRGYGESPPSAEPFRHVDDLAAVIDEVIGRPAWLVGSSMGGALALECCLLASDKVSGLVLLAPGVSGAPTPDLDPDTARLDEMLETADEGGDLEEVNRLETWLWLDGPSQPEGRVAGPARELAKAMNAVILANAVSEEAGSSGIEAWEQVHEIDVPATVACGDLDVPFLVERSRQLAERLPNCRHLVLPGMAHLPYLEQPAAVASLIGDALE